MSSTHEKTVRTRQWSRPGGVKTYAVMVAVVWTLAFGLSLISNSLRETNGARQAALTTARAAFAEDVQYRRWSAGHGGVYAPISESTPPNPHLAHVEERDIETPSGRRLTLINPAYMTRQVHELGRSMDGLRGHITSLNPIRPGNDPDAWEEDALRSLHEGESEVNELAVMEGRTYLRMMRPLITEKGCLACHAQQGYEEGDIRGGISVSVPMEPYMEIVRRDMVAIAGAHISLWMLGMTVILVGARHLARRAAERDRAEAERERLHEQLAQAQKMESVGRLAGGIAHDFNNMLAVILGYADLALDRVDPTEALHEELCEIRKAASRSATLTRQLLAFARKQTTQPRVLDLDETVAGMLSMLRRLLGEDIELHWKPGPGLWPVCMDPGQLDQVLANLCVNARDAMDEGGVITIETRNVLLEAADCPDQWDSAPGPYVVLSVRDSGHGMDAETRARLFEPFFTTKQPGKGTGLGLAMVYGIVKQNRGTIQVSSEPGEGAEFRIYLPPHELASAESPDHLVHAL